METIHDFVGLRTVCTKLRATRYFFGIGQSLSDVKNDITNFWREANGKIHMDGWEKVKSVDGHKIEAVKRNASRFQTKKLFFINLGGYKQNEFEEYHYKMLTIAVDKEIAIQKTKQTAFYKHSGFEDATSHIDDKYGIDVDDTYEIEDILPSHLKEQYSIQITKDEVEKEDKIHLGYLKIDKI